MSDQKFQEGDIVRLKSGGPKMTVKGYQKYMTDDYSSYLCVYYDEPAREFRESYFKAAMLKEGNKDLALV